MEPPASLVLLDVDGVLNPAGFTAWGYRTQWVFPSGLVHRLLLNPRHGQMLTELADATGAELVWASYWQDRANTWIAPRVGLPSLRYVPIPTRWTRRPRPSPGPWKARHIAAWVGQTPFVWLEDDPNVTGCLAQEPNLGQHLVVKIDPAIGLTQHHVEHARAWLGNLRL